jgi:hypothetical protein
MLQKLSLVSPLARFNLKASHLNFLLLGITTVGLVSPASAQTSITTTIYQRTTTYDNYSQPTVTNFIYGSPIPTPVPVNPITGQIINGSNYSIPQVRRYRHHSYPPVRQYFRNQTFVNPVLVNPRIHNSIIISPRN